jgi:hypothetical protein
LPRHGAPADSVQVRPRLLLIALVVPLLAACTGADAVEAQQLLLQAQDAQKSVKSETFTANLTVEAQGQSFAVKVTGGGYAKGAHAGDMYLDLSLTGSSALGLPASSFRVVKRGPSVSMRMGSQKFSFPAGRLNGTATTGASTTNPLAGFDITEYVKDVKVDGGQVLNGKAVTKVTGVLDTSSLVGDLAKLGSSFGKGTEVPKLDGQIGDTRVIGYIDDSTHLLIAALAEVTAQGKGMDAKVHLEYGLTSVNKPVHIPSS